MNRAMLVASLAAAFACGGGATSYSSDPAANQVAGQLSGHWSLVIGDLCPATTPGAIEITTAIASPGIVNGGGTWSCANESGPFAVTVTLSGAGWNAAADFYRSGYVSLAEWKGTGDYAPSAMSGLVDTTGAGTTTVWTAQHR